MNKYLFSLAIFAIPILGYSQSNLILNINHKLGNSSFNFGQNATNNQGDVFGVTRLEYYIAEVKLTYDGGQDTTLQDFWILVNGGTTTNMPLGTFNISTLESVSFGIGVQSSINHLDPTAYPAAHPLSPKSPSMHWGWTAGYRFVAMEGTAASKSDIFQIHALGDANYHIQTINTSGKIQGGDLIIDLDADYEKALENITVNSGLINHGSNGEASVLLNNFKNHVFSEAGSGIGLVETGNTKMSIFPNPMVKGNGISIEIEQGDLKSIKLLDVAGRLIMEGNLNFIENETKNLSEGSYIISLEFEEGSVLNQKLLILQ